jgi:hypothetical protein
MPYKMWVFLNVNSSFRKTIKINEHHTTKAYWGSGGMALGILDLDTRRR